MAPVRHRAAVLGRPIGHSLSPVIHNAGYAAAGLPDWHYSSYECDAPELAGFVADLGLEWAGLSLTMPLKEVALGVADRCSPLAETLGAANTLYRADGGWTADNTDAGGMVDALGWAGVSRAERVALLGAGGTARAALAAAAELRAAEVTVYARRRAATDALLPVADRLGIPLRARGWDDVAGAGDADLLISTVPAGVADDPASRMALRPGSALFDVLYHPWPTPLAVAAEKAGCTVVGGLELLLGQAVRQFERFTGVTAPVAAMRQAVHAAVDRG